jgi:hypothetical protein
MDHATFDRLTRRLGTPSTRRTGISLALSAALGLFVTDEPGVDGKGKNKKKRQKKKKQAKRGCPETSIDCGGGVCVPDGKCCPGEKPCGGGCIRVRDCCPHTERSCPNGVCVAKDACCPIVETACGSECCGDFEECCNGECQLADGGVCTADGWCPPLIGWPCCDESVSDCSTSPCCDIAAGEACCVSSLDPIETTCCPGAERCAPGGCCPAGMKWKGDCEACCTSGTTGCSSCQAPGPGRG